MSRDPLIEFIIRSIFSCDENELTQVYYFLQNLVCTSTLPRGLNRAAERGRMTAELSIVLARIANGQICR